MTFCAFQDFILLTSLSLLYPTYCYLNYQSLFNSTSLYRGAYSEKYKLIRIAVALDLEIDFQVMLQKNSISHNSYIEKHLAFLLKEKKKKKGNLLKPQFC